MRTILHFSQVGGTDETAASTEMGCVVMDYHKRSGRDGSDHIFSNLSGPRPCEPSSVAVVATHQTLTELLITLRLGLEGNAAVAQAQPLLRDLLVGPDKELREGFRSAVAALTAPALANVASIVGCTASGYVTEGGARGDALRGRAIGQQPLGAEHGEGVHAELVALGRRWGRHVSEPWRLMFLTGAYVAAAVTFGVPLFRTAYFVLAKLAGIPYDACSGGVSAFILGGSDPNACSAGFVVLGTALAALDSALFIFFPVLAGRLLRAWEGRALMHRFGKRTVVVADVPWVSRCTEQFGSRVFALSYGFACPEFHTADPVDDLIHRFGHRSVRGLLLLVGRPDGRLFAFTKTESAVLLSCKQMSFVENLGENPEVLFQHKFDSFCFL